MFQFLTRSDQFFWSEGGLSVVSENGMMEKLYKKMDAESQIEKELIYYLFNL